MKKFLLTSVTLSVLAISSTNFVKASLIDDFESRSGDSGSSSPTPTDLDNQDFDFLMHLATIANSEGVDLDEEKENFVRFQAFREENPGVLVQDRATALYNSFLNEGEAGHALLQQANQLHAEIVDEIITLKALLELKRTEVVVFHDALQNHTVRLDAVSMYPDALRFDTYEDEGSLEYKFAHGLVAKLAEYAFDVSDDLSALVAHIGELQPICDEAPVIPSTAFLGDDLETRQNIAQWFSLYESATAATTALDIYNHAAAEILAQLQVQRDSITTMVVFNAAEDLAVKTGHLANIENTLAAINSADVAATHLGTAVAYVPYFGSVVKESVGGLFGNEYAFGKFLGADLHAQVVAIAGE